MQTDTHKNILLRLRRIEGQVRGIQRMIETETECGEILNQITAIKSAINKVGIMVFEGHARECIIKSFNEADDEESFQEVVKMMSRFIK